MSWRPPGEVRQTDGLAGHGLAQDGLTQFAGGVLAIVGLVQRDAQGGCGAGDFVVNAAADFPGQFLAQTEHGARRGDTGGIVQGQAGGQADDLDQVTGVPQFIGQCLLVAQGVGGHGAETPGCDQVGGQVGLMGEVVLLGFRFPGLDGDQFADVVNHAQHEGFIGFGVAGQRRQGAGGKGGGQGMAPEVSQLLPLVTTELEQELAERGGQDQGMKAASAQPQQSLVDGAYAGGGAIKCRVGQREDSGDQCGIVGNDVGDGPIVRVLVACLKRP